MPHRVIPSIAATDPSQPTLMTTNLLYKINRAFNETSQIPSPLDSTWAEATVIVTTFVSILIIKSLNGGIDIVGEGW